MKYIGHPVGIPYDDCKYIDTRNKGYIRTISRTYAKGKHTFQALLPRRYDLHEV